MTKLRTQTTLKNKLRKLIFGILSLVTLSILGLVSWLNMRTEQTRLAGVEVQVRTAIESKARVLIDNHALALRGLVADNVFSDVQALIERTVSEDPEVVYGVFVDSEGAPWAYASPTTQARPQAEGRVGSELLTELGLNATTAHVTTPQAHPRTLFSQGILELARPVVVDGEQLGTVRYGFTTLPLTQALAQARAESQAALLTLLQMIALCVVCSTVLGFVWVNRAASRIVQPLHVLKDATDRIARGELGVRVHVASGDESEALAIAFNGMQQANEDAMKRLSDAMEAALEASRLKSEFLANMSHEIRTPMNGVLGMIRLILEQPLEGKLRRYAETVDVSASALMTIINDILDFSKMEAGKYDIQSAPFEPRTVVQEVAELLAGRAQDKGIELVYRTELHVPAVVTGDPDRYRQILHNLVGNAIKFTDHGEIYVEQQVQAAEGDGYVLYTMVQDTGTGIAAEDLDKLFNAFSQVDGSMVRRHGGTGLGLAISKRIAEMMGGEIGVSSEPGIGSRFWFTIRVGASNAPPLPSAGHFPEGRRALVVEASRRWCRIIEEHMLAWGVACDVFQDGAPALARLSDPTAPRYDVAVIGAELRDISIERLVQGLRAKPEAAQLPLIVLTQLGASATLSEVEKEVAAQLAKPLRLSELYECILGAFTGMTHPRSQPRLKARALPGNGKRILIVDDNQINQFVATEQVEACGFEVHIANNGQEAVQKVKNNRYAIVLMDCQMPVMDGYAAARAIRAWEAATGKRVPIIALTAHAMAGERDKVLAAGMDDYLSKPLRAHALEKMLQRYVGANPESEHAVAHGSMPAQPLELDPTVRRSPKVCRLFLNQVPETLNELASAVQSEPAKVRDLAHKLKGSCLALGADRMAGEAEALQHESAVSDFNNAHERTERLCEQFETIRGLLESELARADGASEKRVSNSIRP